MDGASDLILLSAFGTYDGALPMGGVPVRVPNGLSAGNVLWSVGATPESYIGRLGSAFVGALRWRRGMEYPSLELLLEG